MRLATNCCIVLHVILCVTLYSVLCFQDTFRLSGAKAQRHIFLFEKCVLIAKRKEDGNFLTKAHIMVSWQK